MIVKLRVRSWIDRNGIVIGLTNAGYKTWLEEKLIGVRTEFYVCFEYKKEKEE